MLIRPQPLNNKTSLKMKAGKDSFRSGRKIKSVHVGKLFDGLDYDSKRKISLSTKFIWLYHDIQGICHNFRYSIRNNVRWFKTISQLRPWEGFGGLINVMRFHLKDYIEMEEKYGHSEESVKNAKIVSAKRALRLLKRMQDPDGYTSRRLDAAKKKYPDYKSLITRYENGSVMISGDFVAFGDGWIGREAGKNPREGYFEISGSKFVSKKCSNPKEVIRVLAELDRYNEDVQNAFKQAGIDSDKDFARLHKILKRHLYSWWD
ncbi:MAG: hypothetical protein LBS21_06480 [Clostridiales bacterium]|nr:hypothetical protein [Clostridiales bacterium]